MPYIAPESSLLKSPFAVFVDHAKQAVVITIRGTMSTTDLLADFYAFEKQISWMQGSQACYADTHLGFYQIAENILNELFQSSFATLLANDSQSSNYKIICTGHSLGAAVACLLAFLLKNRDDLGANRNIYAICYSPPACTISEAGLAYFKTFCTSVVLRNDLICRLSISNLVKLQEQICHELQNSRLRKMDVIASAIIRKIFRFRAPDADAETYTDWPSVLNETPMFMPGNVLHLVKPSDILETSSKQYIPFWVDARLFKGILVSSSMGIDHLPNIVGDALRNTVTPTP
jgi:sn1-specific diacylglycerol lipase